MANKIIPKKSSVVGKQPLASDLQVGEIALNLADKKLFSKDAGGTVIELGGGGSSLPAQTGNGGKYLTTDGTTASWATIDLSAYLTTSAAASAYQPKDADLTAIAALAGTSGLLKKTAADTWTLDTTSYLSSLSVTTDTANYGSGLSYASGTLTLAKLLNNIAALQGTGFIKRDAAGAASIDTSTYLTTTSAGSTYLALAGGTLTGDVTLSGASRRVLADLSNNTVGSRLLFQDSTTNNPSAVGVIPNGTATTATWQAYNASTPDNSSTILVGVTATESTIRADKLGTGSYLPLTVYAGGAKRFQFGTSGQFGIGATGDYGTAGQVLTSNGPNSAATWTTPTASDSTKLPLAGGTLTGSLTFSGAGLKILGDFSNATLASRLMFQTSTTNGATSIFAIPNGTSDTAAWTVFNGTDPANAGLAQLRMTSGEAAIAVSANGTGTQLPLAIYTNGLKRFQVGTAGQWGIGATPDYGTAGQVLTSGGPSAAPTWTTPTASDSTKLPLAGGTMTGLLQLSQQGSINTTTPGLTNYGLHFTGQTTADYAAGITWNGGTGTTGAQAGIYVQGSGAYGTKMYLATTDSYATGAKTAISIDHTGLVNFVRNRPTYAGNVILDAANYSGYSAFSGAVSGSRLYAGYDSGVAGSVNTNAWFRTSGANGMYYASYGRGISPTDGVVSYGNNCSYGTGLNGWQGYSVTTDNKSILMGNGSNVGIYNASAGIWLYISDMSGNATFAGNVTAYSDLRLKQNVREIDNIIERRDTLAMAAIKYERDGRTRVGYGAQTLLENGCSEFVIEADDALKTVTGLGTLSVDYGETAAVLAVVSKMTDERVAALEARIAELEQQLKI